jgi:hypothetical protein
MMNNDGCTHPRIAELEAEVAEVCSVARGLRDKLDEIKEVVGGASLHPETGVSVVDDVRDLLKELADLRQVAQGLRVEVKVLTEIRANQAHLIKCLQSEVTNLKGDASK